MLDSAGDSGLLFEGRRITMFKLGSRCLQRMAMALGFLVLAVFSDSGVRMNKHTSLVLPQLGNVMALYGAEAVTIDRNARDFKLPDQFAWQDRPGSASKTVTLFGDPSKAGLYVQITKRGPNDWSEPHSHPNERFITPGRNFLDRHGGEVR